MFIELAIAVILADNPANTVRAGLDRESCMEARHEILNEWKAEQRPALELNLKRKYVQDGETRMPFDVQLFGDEPEGGRSLWISLHGGGGTTSRVNDGQWRNQTRLYMPNNSVYICPRAPWDAWNMWFQDGIDKLFEEIIRTVTVIYDINPDKVYIMGYSAGGDGVWRLAPRLADHWAAAAMMAGHPGDVRLENVRNLPFTLWVGGEDLAYRRNEEVALRGLQLDSLQKSDPEGYVHQTHVLPGLPHWMERRDTAAVKWMASFTRNAHPSKVVWTQEEVLRKTFYWIEVPEDELKRGKTVIAETDGSTIRISRCDYSSITIYLDDDMMDLDRDVTVEFNGKKMVFRPERKAETLRSTLEERGDPQFMFPASIHIDNMTQ